MSWEKLAHHRIEEAIAAGELDDLPGHGQSLNLDAYFAFSPAERAGTALLKNAGVLPPEMEILKRIARLEAALAAAITDADRNRLRAELQEQRVTFALTMERRRRRDTGA